MSDYRSEASSRSAVKTELTAAHLECLLISLASGLFVAAVWMQIMGASQVRSSSAGSQRCRWSCMRAVVPAAVSGDRYPVGYSVAREHVAKANGDNRACRITASVLLYEATNW
jgi:hypothetical protein